MMITSIYCLWTMDSHDNMVVSLLTEEEATVVAEIDDSLMSSRFIGRVGCPSSTWRFEGWEDEEQGSS